MVVVHLSHDQRLLREFYVKINSLRQRRIDFAKGEEREWRTGRKRGNEEDGKRGSEEIIGKRKNEEEEKWGRIEMWRGR